MFKAQYKNRSPFETWKTAGSYGTEAQAITVSLRKKTQGAILVRVIDRKGSVVYSN